MPGNYRCDHCGLQFTRPHVNRPSIRFCSRSCRASSRRGNSNPNWRGGMVDHPLYRIWTGMNERCERASHKDFFNYGGRGITVCDRWRDDFWAFVADMGDRPEGMSLDRIDNDRGYEPNNCRWATASEQRLNQRRTNTSESVF